MFDLALDNFHVFLDIRYDYFTIVIITNWSFLFIAHNYTHIVKGTLGTHWFFYHHEDVFVLDLLELPLWWLLFEVVVFVWLSWLRWRLLSWFFAVFLFLLDWWNWTCWLFRLLLFRWFFTWFSQLRQFFDHIGFIKINRYFSIPVRNIGIWRARDSNHDIIDIGYLDSSTFGSYLSMLDQLIQYFRWFGLKSVV